MTKWTVGNMDILNILKVAYKTLKTNKKDFQKLENVELAKLMLAVCCYIVWERVKIVYIFCLKKQTG